MAVRWHLFMDNIEEICCYYVSFLRSISLVHQNHHWLTKGKNFYGNHLMFERIYNAAIEDVDAIAEKFVGVFNSDTLNLNKQSHFIQKILVKYANMEPLEGSLKIEEDFIEFSKHFYDVLEKENALTLGLEDIIPAISSNRETAVYLLKGASCEKDASISPVVSRINFLKKLQKLS